MANILETYGIKEVADVTFLDIKTEVPVLYLDTLKVSTIEETAETTEARGGKGNAALISWDYGKEITLNIEDALYSPKSMALMHAKELKDSLTTAASTIVTKYIKYKGAGTTVTKGNLTVLPEKEREAAIITKIYDGEDLSATSALSGTTINLTKDTTYIIEYTVPVVNYTEIKISADGFPGTYKVIGDTWARRQEDGKDQYFQFVIYQAKVSAENTITLEAEGDPSVFSMTLKVLRPDDHIMMSLIQYEIED